MLDEIVDYVKFLRLQVKVLSMSRLGGAGAVAPLFTDTPISSIEEEGTEGVGNQPSWEKWSNDGTEQQVAKLMDENVIAPIAYHIRMMVLKRELVLYKMRRNLILWTLLRRNSMLKDSEMRYCSSVALWDRARERYLQSYAFQHIC